MEISKGLLPTCNVLNYSIRMIQIKDINNIGENWSTAPINRNCEVLVFIVQIPSSWFLDVHVPKK